MATIALQLYRIEILYNALHKKLWSQFLAVEYSKVKTADEKFRSMSPDAYTQLSKNEITVHILTALYPILR